MAEHLSFPREVVLHLGAHKTASTHFAQLLSRNPGLLRDWGVAAPLSNRVRPLVTSSLSGRRAADHGVEGLRAGIAALAGGARRLIVADENILGVPRALLGNDQMYPRAARRLSRAVDLFPGARVEVMMALRDPATFVPASWAESLRRTGHCPFRDYLNGVPARRISWLHVITQLRRAAPGIRFTLWRYEDYGALLPRIVAVALAASDHAVNAVDMGMPPLRVGPSQRALDLLSARTRLDGALPDEDTVQALMARHPKGPDLPPPRPWSQWERRALSARYVSDWDRIGGIEGVTILQPGPPSLALPPPVAEVIAVQGTHSSAG